MIDLPRPRYILPNLFTLASAFCGFALIWLAFGATEGSAFYNATLLVPIACLLDGFDGRIARLVHGESALGVQLDSLSDFLTFGVAPAFLIYAWALHDLGVVGLVVAFAFASAAMIRLARFNVDAADDHGVSRYFRGLPAPMAGLGIAAIVAVETGVLARGDSAAGALPAVAALVVMLALLMVSNVPFRTFKDLRMTARNRLFVAGALASIVVVSLRFDFMFAIACALFAYLATGLTGGVVVARRMRLANGSTVVIDEEEPELDVFDPSDDDLI